jgi:hypothetical protein
MAKKQTAKDALRTLGKIATDAIAQSNIDTPTGRCVYTTTSGTHCAVLTEDFCEQLHGTWTQGGSCT